MVFVEETYDDVKLYNRINLQLLMGILGIVIVILSSILSTMWSLVTITVSPSDWTEWYFLSQATYITGLIASIFIGVGILGVLKKHHFKFLWVIALIISLGLIFRQYDIYLIRWAIEVVDDFSIVFILIPIRTLILSFVSAICYLLVRNRFRNKILLWNLILGSFYIMALRQVLWFVLYPPDSVVPGEWTVFLPYHIGTLIVAIIYSFLVMILFIDERRYGMQSLEESIEVTRFES